MENNQFKCVYFKPGEKAKTLVLSAFDLYIHPKNIAEKKVGDAVIVYDKTAKESGLPMNRLIVLDNTVDESSFDIIHGIFFVVQKDENGAYVSVEKEVCEDVINKCMYPHIFMLFNNQMIVFHKFSETELVAVQTIVIQSDKDEVPDDVVLFSKEEVAANE